MTVPANPNTGASYGAPAVGATPSAVQMVQRDMAGHIIEPAPQARVEGGCSHVHVPGSPLCAPRPITDPTSMGPIIVATISLILLICGGLIYFERGPGQLIRPKPRRRGATLRARRLRKQVGSVLVVLGVLGLARTFL